MTSYAKGSVLFTENAFLSVQTQHSRQFTLCCVVCLKHIGGWESQVKLIDQHCPRRKDKIRICKEFCIRCVNVHCDEVFCSQACFYKGVHNGHLIECGSGNIETICELVNNPIENIVSAKFDDRECASAAAEFRRHSLGTDELYLCARRVIVTLASPHLLFKQGSKPISSAGVKSGVEKTIEEFLTYFPLKMRSAPSPPSLPCSTTALLTDFPELGDEESLYDSWLLLTSSFLQLGVDCQSLGSLLSYPLYRLLVRGILPLHVRHLKCEGSDGLNPLQRRLLQACTENEYELMDARPGGEERHAPSESTRAVWAVSRRLFPSAFTRPADSESDGEYSKVCRYSSVCPALAIMAAVSSSLSAEDEGGRALDTCSCVSLVLLPHCSRYSRHSCLPSALYFHAASVTALNSEAMCENPPSDCTYRLSHDCLVSSSALMVTLEAERDFVCTCSPEHRIRPDNNTHTEPYLCRWVGNCECSGSCEDGFSVSLLSDAGLDLASRSAALRPLLRLSDSAQQRNGTDTHDNHRADTTTRSCRCIRCDIEGVQDLHVGITNSNLYVARSLGYLYMQIHQMRRAREVFEIMLHRLDLEPVGSSALQLRAELHHALGGAYLSEGNWRKARDSWTSILSRKQTSLVPYAPLHEDLLKLGAYPLYHATVTSIGCCDDTARGDKSFEVCVRREEGSAVEYPASSGVDNLSSLVLLSRGSFVAVPISKSSQAFLTADNNPVLSAEVCSDIIAEAEKYAADRERGWSTSRHYAVPTTDFPVHHCAPILQWFNDIMRNTVVPLLSVQLAETDHALYCSDSSTTVGIHVHDAFIVKYDSGRPTGESFDGCTMQTHQKLLPLHCDESTHSFILPLNEPVEASAATGEGEFEGGGTYFHDLHRVIAPGKGHLLSFAGGKSLHGGAPVTRGTRYILAVFLYIDVTTTSSRNTELPDGENGMSPRPVTSPLAKRQKIEFLGNQSHSFSFQF